MRWGRKELQKHSNIVLSSMAIAELLVGAIAMPMIATANLLIVPELSLEHACLYIRHSQFGLNALLFLFPLFTTSPWLLGRGMY